MAGNEEAPRILVWFEDDRKGHTALMSAYHLALARDAQLTVLAVSTHERVIGCGRCLQGTVLWNIEMDKMAREALIEARRVLGDVADVSYQVAVGDPADAITEVASRIGADTILLPRQRNRRLDPPSRRNVDTRIAGSGPWQVVAIKHTVAV